MYNYIGDNMKKIIKIFICITLLTATGCSKKDIVNDDIPVTVSEDKITISEPIYKDENPVMVATYNYNNTNFYKINEYSSSWYPLQDILSFNILYCNDDLLPINYTANTYLNCKAKYEDNNKYKTGINIYFTHDNDQIVNYTITKVEDWLECNGYLLIYFYDAVKHMNDSWYSHTTVNEFNENSNITSIKICGGDYIDKVTSDIIITIFTYDSEDDFDEEGHYKGNSKHTLTLKRI